MLALATYSRLVVAPEIQVASPQREQLGRLHAVSGLLLIAQTLLGAFAIGLTLMIGH
jgi:hypothetical protein